MIVLAFSSGMVSGDTCLSKQCCQQLPGIQSEVTHMIDEFIKDIQSIQSGCNCNRTRSPSTIGRPLKTITGIDQPLYISITDNSEVFISGYGDGYVHKFDKYGNFKRNFLFLRVNQLEYMQEAIKCMLQASKLTKFMSIQ